MLRNAQGETNNPRSNKKKVPPTQQKETPILMFVNWRYFEITKSGKKKYIPLKYATGEKIKPHQWNFNNNQPKRITTNANLITKLENLEKLAKDVIRELEIDKIKLTPTNVKNKLDEKNERIEIVEYRPETLNQFIETFISEIKSGKRLTKDKTVYKYSTIKNYLNFQVKFNKYQQNRHKVLDYQDITMDFYDDYINWFMESNCSRNYIGRHIKSLKVIMRAAFDLKLHSNVEIERKKFKTLNQPVTNIYLTEKEIRNIHTIDLSNFPTLDRARDVFLLGCYTAQRFSDYSRINQNHIITLDNGSKAIQLTQQKTGQMVIIPIRPELDEILRKYDYVVPKTWEQKVNEGIKEVGRMAEINQPVTTESNKGGKKVCSTIPKYKLIKTHTGRRSACTNMYLAGIRPIDIMKVSGHTTEKTFLTYIKINQQETAESLSVHPYFNQHLKIAK